MSTVPWDSFFTGLAGFGGVVFAITLAARQLSGRDLAQEKLSESRTRLWDSMAVTFELAAAAFFAILFSVRAAPIFVGVVGTAVAVVGLILNAIYLSRFVRLHRLRRQSRGEIAFAWMSVLPVAAYVTAAITLWFGAEPILLFTAAVTWLVLSGTLQAMLWYLRSWDLPDDDQD
jgi:hypothetical protein